MMGYGIQMLILPRIFIGWVKVPETIIHEVIAVIVIKLNYVKQLQDITKKVDTTYIQIY
jgi:hypothetical protein